MVGRPIDVEEERVFRGDGVSGASWMPLRFWLLAAIIAVVVGTAAVVAYLSWNVRFTAEKALEVNWGLELPRGSEILEHHKEDSFQGDGYRFTVVSVEHSPEGENRICGPGADMDIGALTNKQVELFMSVTDALRPKVNLTTLHGLKKTEFSREDGSVLLCLFDERTSRFYIYEELF